MIGGFSRDVKHLWVTRWFCKFGERIVDDLARRSSNLYLKILLNLSKFNTCHWAITSMLSGFPYLFSQNAMFENSGGLKFLSYLFSAHHTIKICFDLLTSARDQPNISIVIAQQ